MNKEQYVQENLMEFALYENELLRLNALPFADVVDDSNHFKGFYIPFNEMISFYAFSNIKSKNFKFVIEPTINHSKYKDEFKRLILKLNSLAGNANFPFNDLVREREYKGRYQGEYLNIHSVLFQSPRGSVATVASVLGGGACSQLALYNKGVGGVSSVARLLHRLNSIFSYDVSCA